MCDNRMPHRRCDVVEVRWRSQWRLGERKCYSWIKACHKSSGRRVAVRGWHGETKSRQAEKTDFPSSVTQEWCVAVQVTFKCRESRESAKNKLGFFFPKSLVQLSIFYLGYFAQRGFNPGEAIKPTICNGLLRNRVSSGNYETLRRERGRIEGDRWQSHIYIFELQFIGKQESGREFNKREEALKHLLLYDHRS